MKNPVLVASSRVAVAAKAKDPVAEHAARQSLAAAKLEREILAANAEPITDDDRARLVALLAKGAK
jgi:hypothetical protein